MADSQKHVHTKNNETQGGDYALLSMKSIEHTLIAHIVYCLVNI